MMSWDIAFTKITFRKGNVYQSVSDWRNCPHNCDSVLTVTNVRWKLLSKEKNKNKQRSSIWNNRLYLQLKIEKWGVSVGAVGTRVNDVGSLFFWLGISYIQMAHLRWRVTIGSCVILFPLDKNVLWEPGSTYTLSLLQCFSVGLSCWLPVQLSFRPHDNCGLTPCIISAAACSLPGLLCFTNLLFKPLGNFWAVTKGCQTILHN